jgi:HAE1 family hydrophobic/amphiphilic exporter-1/multidrug efflux pump
VPLAIATGAGAGARQSIGTTVVSGMLIATMIGILVIPVFYVIVQRLSERKNPFRYDEEHAAREASGARPAENEGGPR